MRILIVEDEERIASFLTKGLTAIGFEVQHVATGTEGIAAAADADVVLLDLGLPDVDGISVLSTVRGRFPDAQIIVVTARADLGDRVEGLERGADDYLVKPFAFDELVARIRARLRARASTSMAAMEHDGIEIDRLDRRVRVDGRTLDLSAKEFEVLRLLTEARGDVVDRRTLLADVWDYHDFEPRSNPLEVYVSSLRRKLGRDRIETVRGRGYRLRPARR